MEIILDGRKKKVKAVKTVEGLVSALKMNDEEILVKVNGKLASDGTNISSNDVVKVMRVIFGG